MNKLRPKVLICDLDGTLIDSSRGVLAALKKACGACGVETILPLDRHLVGPPLDEMLRRVTGINDLEKLRLLRTSFISHYDSGECILAEPFPGIDDLLKSALKLGFHLALATNKRLLPTAKILEAKGWQKIFRQVETVDSQPNGNQSKAQMIRNIKKSFSETAYFLYLGDTEWDVIAAREAEIECILVTWGYQSPNLKCDSRRVSSPAEVVPFLISPN